MEQLDTHMETPESQLAKQGLQAAIEAVKDFLNKIVGPPLEEVGGLLADPIRLYRFKNQVRIVQKAEAFLKSVGVNPKKVPLKTLAPLLENGSLEEDDSMIDKWAALLASAADERGRITVQPSFPEILKELSPVEAHILDKVYEMVLSIPIPRGEWMHRGAVGSSIKEVVRLDNVTFEVVIDNLYRLRLCSPPSTMLEFIDQPQQKFQLQMKEIICLTELGFAFVSACRPPTKDG